MIDTKRPRLRYGAISLATALLLGSAVTLAPQAHAEEGSEFRFDFGPVGGAVEPGFTEVTRETLYTEELGYGFTSTDGMIDRDRGSGAGNAMERDFIASFNNPYEFLVDIDNGIYDIHITVGETAGTARSNFVLEGVDVGGLHASNNVVSATYEEIEVGDGQLNVNVSGNTGHISGLEISPSFVGPLNLTATDVSFHGPVAHVSLDWDSVAAAVSYNVYRNAGVGPEQIGTTEETSFLDDSAPLGQIYNYTVRAVNDAGAVSSASEPVEVQAVDEDVAVPAAPTGLAVQAIDRNSVTLVWDAVESAETYTVYRSDRYNAEVAIAHTTEAVYTDNDVLTTIEYTYRVSATNAGGMGEFSEPLISEAVTTLVREAEYLDRAPLAVVVDDGVYLGWRLLGLDDTDIKFHVYRDGAQITSEWITDSTNLLDTDGDADSVYRVSALIDGVEYWVTEDFEPWAEQYLDIPLDRPEGGTGPDGVDYVYHANDASVGDFTGDGTYDILLKWDPSNAKDNAHSGNTGNVYLDAIQLDGTLLWRIDLGRNIRAGAHYSQPMVYDFDGDGRAEVIVKTADGTVDGAGNVIGDPDADYRNSGGYILNGPEFLTVFDGVTGEAIDTVDYHPPRGDVASWGDGYGNRVDRFLAGVAYLDGESPTAIFSRGYYTRTVLTAYDFDGENLTERWIFDSGDEGNGGYAGQGNHQLSIADVDGDGKDEIIFGSATINDDGAGLYNTGLGHGDAMHVGDHIPGREGLEVFAVHESMGSSGNRAATMRDAATGEILWDSPGDRDTGRGTAGDIDPRYDGNEAWHVGGTYAWDSQEGHLFSAEGELITTSIPAANFVTWWDGDLLREITDHRFDSDLGAGDPVVYKWDWENEVQVPIFEPDGVLSNNHTKGTPSLQADLFGDWREELVFRTDDSSALRVFTTTDVTEHRIYTLMQDPTYRLAVAWQNVSYNQPPHPGFFLGEGMEEPPTPSIRYTIEPPALEPVEVDDPDVTPPTVTVKEGAEFTVGSAEDGYEMVSFKLYDEFRIDKVVINGVVKDLVDNQWSDVNFVAPGVFGAALGTNVMEVFDVAGNVTTVEFVLVDSTPAVPAWNASQIYTAGDQVSHEGALYVAQWWTQGQTPGDPTGAWAEVGASVPAAGEDVRAWTASWVYTGGEIVAYEGHTWRAKWWTRNQAPGDAWGPWEDLGQY